MRCSVMCKSYVTVSCFKVGGGKIIRDKSMEFDNAIFPPKLRPLLFTVNCFCNFRFCIVSFLIF